jgi:hypothetical protein
MSGEVSGPQVMSACIAAGFRGDALINIVAIGYRESGWNDTIQGDLNLVGGAWGPSVGVFQIRTLVADTGTGSDRDLQALVPGAVVGRQNSGAGNLTRQAQAAWNISGHGTEFSAWSTWRGLPQDAIDKAQAALNSMSPTDIANAMEGKTTRGAGDGGGGLLGDPIGGIASAVDRGLGAVLGYEGTFSEWAGMVVIRSSELLAGGLLMAAGGIVMLDVIFSGRAGAATNRAARGSGLVARSVGKGVGLAKKATVAGRAIDVVT